MRGSAPCAGSQPVPAAARHWGQHPAPVPGSPSLQGEQAASRGAVHACGVAPGRAARAPVVPEPLQDGSSRMWVTLLYLGSPGSTARKSCWASWRLVTLARVSMVFMVAKRFVSTSKAKI